VIKIEVVAYNVESALKAQEGGADRIELCSSPGDGGVTPSFGVIEVVRQNINIDLFVMIRPRGGDFIYSNYEYHAMKRDIWQCQKLSVDGIVFGILNSDGTIDKKRCSELIQRIKPLQITCHRAFDLTRDPFEALEDCIEVGFNRILTSGQRNKAEENTDLISKLIKHAGDRITIMPGSGIHAENALRILEETKATELHTSAMTYRKSEMEFSNPSITGMGSDKNENEVRTVDVEKIKALRRIGDGFMK
jgi:copper homeostasis protein